MDYRRRRKLRWCPLAVHHKRWRLIKPLQFRLLFQLQQGFGLAGHLLHTRRDGIPNILRLFRCGNGGEPDFFRLFRCGNGCAVRQSRRCYRQRGTAWLHTDFGILATPPSHGRLLLSRNAKVVLPPDGDPRHHRQSRRHRQPSRGRGPLSCPGSAHRDTHGPQCGPAHLASRRWERSPRLHPRLQTTIRPRLHFGDEPSRHRFSA